MQGIGETKNVRSDAGGEVGWFLIPEALKGESAQ